MEYLLDSANLETIKRFIEYFPITGITSNPSIVKKEGKIDFFAHMNKIRSIIGQNRTLHIQVTATDVEGMLRDADSILSKVDGKVYIKVPVTIEGLKVMKILKARGINVTATAIYSKAQGFLALEAGADYMAPYYNRMENLEINPEDVIASFAKMISQYGYSTKIVAASFKNIGQVNKAFLAGAQTATVAPDVLEGAFAMPSIQKAVDDFTSDWQIIYGDKTIADLD
ncbi:MAG: fructose-6-phosphate aldolase [Clostridium sp.]|uniref:fructose-6-phosphate aldolase n=1 Tax=Clostridium sp. TaxID=1506 RepID=UPI003D6D0E0C